MGMGLGTSLVIWAIGKGSAWDAKFESPFGTNHCATL